MKFIIAAACAATLIPAAALAQQAATAPTGLYGTLGYAGVRTSGVDLGAIQGRVGWRFNNWLGVEGEFAAGVKDANGSQTINGTTVNTKIKLNDEEAIYGVGFLPLSDRFDVLGRIGYGHQGAKVSATAVGTGGPVTVSDTARGDSWNYGAGVQYHFDGANGIRGDYTREQFTRNNSGHADVWAVAFSHRF